MFGGENRYYARVGDRGRLEVRYLQPGEEVVGFQHIAVRQGSTVHPSDEWPYHQTNEACTGKVVVKGPAYPETNSSDVRAECDACEYFVDTDGEVVTTGKIELWDYREEDENE